MGHKGAVRAALLAGVAAAGISSGAAACVESGGPQPVPVLCTGVTPSYNAPGFPLTVRVDLTVAAGAQLGDGVERLPLRLNADNDRVTVESGGSIITGPSAPATLPLPTAITATGSFTDLIIRARGVVQGENAGFTNQSGREDFSSTSAGLRLDNAGLLSGGQNGISLFVGGDALRVINRAGGTVRGGENAINVSAPGFEARIGSIVNDGLISGGVNSIRGDRVRIASITNNAGGVIEGTIDVPALEALDNRWLINGRAAPAVRIRPAASFINRNGALELTNRTGGVIRSDGPIAIDVQRPAFGSERVSIDNAGRIVGSVQLDSRGASRVIQRAGGVIEGDLLLPAFSTLLIEPGADGAGVTGRILVAGSDTGFFGFAVSADSTGALPALPAGFGKYVVEFPGGRGPTDIRFTVTGLGTPGANLSARNQGTLISAVDLTVIDREAILGDSIINRGTIDLTVTPGSRPVTALSGAGPLTANEGTINVRGSGATALTGSAQNRGLIRLFDGATALLGSTTFVNTGEIRLESASAVLFGTTSFNNTLDNSGMVTAAAGPAILGNNVVTVRNSGTVVSSTSPAIDASGRRQDLTIDNRAGGAIRGGAGVAIRGGESREFVTNAGSITGDIVLGGGDDSYGGAGSVAGALMLGDGDDTARLDALASPTITGGVDGGGGRDLLVLSARASGTVLGGPATTGFEVTRLEAESDAARGPITVINRTDLSVDAPVLPFFGPREAAAAAVAFATLRNEGALTATGAGAAALAVRGDQVTADNAGRIIVADGAAGLFIASSSSPFPGGPSPVRVALNSGRIEGGGTGVLVEGPGRFRNDGIVEMAAGPAVQVSSSFGSGSQRVENAGLLRAASGPAVRLSAELVTLRNLEAGVIEAMAGPAVESSSFGQVNIINSGRIIGDVRLGDGNDFFSHRGGSIAGALLLGGGDDRLTVGAGAFDTSFASGGVDGGAGFDTIQRDLTESGAVNPAAVTGFEAVGLNLATRGISVTIAAAEAPADFAVLVVGDGPSEVINLRTFDTEVDGLRADGTGGFRLTNRAAITVRASAAALSGSGASSTEPEPGVVLRNEAAIMVRDGATAVRADSGVRVENAGEITVFDSATGVQLGVGSFLFGVTPPELVNSGVIRTASEDAVAVRTFDDGSRVVNSGTIDGLGVAVEVGSAGTTIDNTGTIRGSTGVVVFGSSSANGATVRNEAGGAIEGTSGVAVDITFGTLNLVNRGEIRGSVSSFSCCATIVQDGGTISGGVALGRGADRLHVPSLAATGIAGAITDAGDAFSGLDTIGYDVSGAASVDVAPALAGFEVLALRSTGAADRITTTAAAVSTTGVRLEGPGTFVNEARFNVTGGDAVTFGGDPLAEAGLLTESADGLSGTFVNRAAIDVTRGVGLLMLGGEAVNEAAIRLLSDGSSVGGGPAVSVRGGRFTNAASGRLEANSLAQSLFVRDATAINLGAIDGAAQLNGGARFDNDGTVTARGFAVTAFGSSGQPGNVIVNRGSILSGGVGGSGFGGGPFGGALINGDAATMLLVNEAGAVLGAAAAGGLSVSGSGAVINRGRLVGNADGFGLVYAADGGTLEGDLNLSFRGVLLVRPDLATGVSGRVIAPSGTSAPGGYGLYVSSDQTILLPVLDGFAEAAAWAAGRETDLTLLAGGPADGRRLRLFGDGAVTVQGDAIAVDAQTASLRLLRVESVVTSPGGTGVRAGAERFENTGTVTGRAAAVISSARGGLASTDLAAINGGTIQAVASPAEQALSGLALATGGAVTVENSGTITATGAGNGRPALSITARGAITVTNSGLIESDADAGPAVSADSNTERLNVRATPAALVTVVNSGVIRSTGDGTPFTDGVNISVNPASALLVGPGTVTNAAGGLIEATGMSAIAVRLGSVVTVTGECPSCQGGQTSTLINAGVIRGGPGESFPNSGPNLFDFAPGAVAGRAGRDIVINTGEIVGSIDLREGDDLFENRGRIAGEVRLGQGADRFVQLLTSVISGPVDGGAGADTLVLDTSASGGFDATLFRGFESILVEGGGRLPLTGALPDLTIAGTVVAVGPGAATGGQLTLDGGTLVVNGDASLMLGTGLSGGGLADTVVVAGTLSGAVDLGGDDDVFSLVGGTVLGRDGAPIPQVEGGAGSDTLAVLANAALSFTGAGYSGFETLQTTGSGIVTLDVPAPFGTVRVDGAGLTIASGLTFGGAIVGGDQGTAITLLGAATGPVTLGAGADRLAVSGTLGGEAAGGAGFDIIAFSQSGARSVAGAGVSGFERIETQGGMLTLAGDWTAATIAVDGALTIAGDARFGAVRIEGGANSDSVSILGALSDPSAVALGAGDDALLLGANAAFPGLIETRAALPVLGQAAPAPARVAADGGTGSDRLTVETTAGQIRTITGATAFETLATTGPGTVVIEGVDFARAEVTGNLFVNIGSTFAGAIAGSDAANTVTIGRSVGAVMLGSGDDRLVAGWLFGFASADGGAGIDRFTIDNAFGPRTLPAMISGFEELELTGLSVVTVDRSIAFQSVLSNIDLTVAAGATLTASTLTFGAGDQRFTLVGEFSGAASGGAGADALAVVTAAGVARTLALSRFTDFETLTLGGGGRVDLDGAGAFARTQFAGELALLAGAVLTADVAGSAEADRLILTGRIVGSADLGQGDDVVIWRGAEALSGRLEGGAGRDRLEIAAGTAAVPAAYTTASVSGIEALEVTGGLARYGGALAFGESATIRGGAALFGLPGSRLSAPVITVASGATFGSAGTVAGAIAVQGVLAPGASVGTMTVEGAVSFAGGSRLLLEASAAGVDQLLVSGTVTIASGATLELTGSRPATPGAPVGLVVANGGISGAFSTVVQPASIFGFLRQSATRIDLVGLFQTPPAAAPNVAAAVDYLNRVLVAGQASPALIAIVPGLADGTGAIRGDSFARLTPEPYGAARAVAVENGLGLVDATRTRLRTAPKGREGWSAFAQGLGGWRDLDARGATGVSAANVDSRGVIGGAQYTTDRGTVGAFAGQLWTDQDIPALGGRTRADGVVGGVFAVARLGGFETAALVAYDGAQADTARATPAGPTRSNRYDLGGWVADLSAGYGIALGRGWSAVPNAGLSFVEAARSRTVETGSVYALSVERGDSGAVFGDVGLRLAGELRGWRPFVEAGVRHAFDRPDAAARGGFQGATVDPLAAEGAAIARTAARLAAGASADVSRTLRLFAGYVGDISGAGDRHAVNGGAALRF